METGDQSTRAVNSASGNQALMRSPTKDYFHVSWIVCLHVNKVTQEVVDKCHEIFWMGIVDYTLEVICSL